MLFLFSHKACKRKSSGVFFSLPIYC